MINQCLNIREIVLDLLKQKIEYYSYFACAAELREKNKQFKTEKWLQAEILVYFWRLGFDVIPEYGKCRWDLCIQSNNDKQVKYLLALDCLADSTQSVIKLDCKNVKEDLDAIVEHDYYHGQAYVILILPFGRSQEYATNMWDFIKCYEHHKMLNINKHQILFPCSQEGIEFVFFEKNKDKLPKETRG